jgi:hypothetical protein
MSAPADERRLLEKLRRIEALFAGATTEGERAAAAQAGAKVRERLEAIEPVEATEEHRVTLPDAWSRRVFVALCRRYGLEPYRYRGQRHTTVQIRATRAFVDETLWPEFREIAQVLRDHLDGVTDRIIAEALHRDFSEPTVVGERLALDADGKDG